MTSDFLKFFFRERERERERERRPGALLGVLFASALTFVILNAWTALAPFAYAVNPVTVTATVAQTITCDSDLAGSSTPLRRPPYRPVHALMHRSGCIIEKRLARQKLPKPGPRHPHPRLSDSVAKRRV